MRNLLGEEGVDIHDMHSIKVPIPLGFSIFIKVYTNAMTTKNNIKYIIMKYLAGMKFLIDPLTKVSMSIYLD